MAIPWRWILLHDNVQISGSSLHDDVQIRASPRTLRAAAISYFLSSVIAIDDGLDCPSAPRITLTVARSQIVRPDRMVGPLRHSATAHPAFQPG
jgi:hypothetical protein